MSYSIDSHWVDPQIVVITFSDAERNNQLCWAAIDELGQTLRDHREAGARVVILDSGLPGHWLEHAWLQDLINGIEGRPQTGSGQGWFDVLEEVSHRDIVSIAAISGDSSGGGAEIGWACDLRIAEAAVNFTQPEITMGITTGIGGSSRLARLAGRGVTTEMVLTGRPMNAQRLYELGALNQVVPAGEALSKAIEIAIALANYSPAALQGLKQILANNEQQTLPEALAYEQAAFQSVVGGEEALEGMKAVQARYNAAAPTKDS